MKLRFEPPIAVRVNLETNARPILRKWLVPCWTGREEVNWEAWAATAEAAVDEVKSDFAKKYGTEPPPGRFQPPGVIGPASPTSEVRDGATIPTPKYGFSWWWPSSTLGHWLLLALLVLSVVAGLRASPVDGVFAAGINYLIVIAIRFVFIQATKARSPA